MEAQEVTTTTGLTKDLSLIVKGKRTKRQRPQSPIPFTIAAHSSSDEDAYATSNSGDFLTTEENVLHSPTTEEEEETAKCLILLSQGQDFGTATPKFCSKRYLETHTTGNGKAGIYVYECKTCNRTFPSFQALGGHRASHKKPRAMAEERKKIFVLSDEEEEQEPQPKLKKRSSISSSLSLQLTNRAAIAATFNNKVHECVICGAEFTSGQALGGHMRRHRGSPLVGNSASSATNTILSLSPLSMAMENYIDDDQEPKKFKSDNLSLDLNLPATQEDENGHGDLKLSFPTQQQKQSPLVLPAAPALVDCQY